MSETEVKAIELSYIELKHDELPVQRVYEIDGANYIFRFDYNAVGDFYTYLILDEDENALYAGKLTYLRNSMQGVVAGLSLKRKIVPLNWSDAQGQIPAINRISKDNFDSMRICII